MSWKGNDGQVGNLSTHATGYILCAVAEKTGSGLFYQFGPQGFLKMADDRTVCLTSVSRPSANRWTISVWLSIDH